MNGRPVTRLSVKGSPSPSRLLMTGVEVDAGDLEQLGVEVALPLVELPRLKQAGNQALPQHVFELARGVIDGQPGERPARLEQIGHLLADERHRDRFKEAGRSEDRTDRFSHPVADRLGTDRQRQRHVLRNLVVAVDPRDLFDQIDLAGDIAAPGRRDEFAFAVRPASPAARCPSDVTMRTASSCGTSMPRILRNAGESQRDSRALAFDGNAREDRGSPAARRRPVRGSTGSTGGWPNRAGPCRCRARIDMTHRCAGPACGPCCGSTRGRNWPLRSECSSRSGRSRFPGPPITPPRATGRSASAMTHMPGCKLISLAG